MSELRKIEAAHPGTVQFRDEAKGSKDAPVDLDMPVASVVVGWDGAHFSVFLRSKVGARTRMSIKFHITFKSMYDASYAGKIVIGARDDVTLHPFEGASSAEASKFGYLAWSADGKPGATVRDYIDVVLSRRRDLFSFTAGEDTTFGCRSWCYRVIDDFAEAGLLPRGSGAHVSDYFRQQAVRIKRGELRFPRPSARDTTYTLDEEVIPGTFHGEEEGGH